MAKESARPEALKDRTANVGFASELLETEISRRNARKDAQENTARGVILTASALMTLLLALGTHAGTIAWVFAGMVFFTVGQRIALAVSTLSDQAGRARITSDG